ncbi:MAG: ABC transporter permease [Spirochaetales bacterium]|nr:ABC transporter permease [Spirochaetales bacterium]MCF7937893.1 ABC transporter permease [Spirochaetales bacterium]
MVNANRLQIDFRQYIMEAILIVMIIIFGIFAPGFFSITNMLNILRNVSMQGIIAFGMTLVLISGELDLSVGSHVAFAGCLSAYVTQALSVAENGMLPETAAIIIAMVIVLIIGFLIGVFIGVFRTRFKVPTFITTLALMASLSGAGNLLTQGFPITPFPEWYNFLGGGYIFGIPFPAIIFLIVFFFIHFLANYTSFGRSVYSIGGNEEASRLSGIKVKRNKILIMAIVAVLAALAGLLNSSQIMSGTASTARGWELEIISAVIIGGVSLQGGSGRVWGTFIGVMFIGIMINGMTMLNVSEYWQYVVRGILILSAILINQIKEMNTE